MPENEEIKQSKYNAAVAQLYRLDMLWQKCHEDRLNGRLIKWNNDLDCIWTELASDSISKHMEKYNHYNKLIIKYKSHRSLLNQVLMLKEIFLRKLQNKQGKGTAYQEEDDGL